MFYLSNRIGSRYYARHLSSPLRRVQEGQDPEGDVDHREEVPEAVERDGSGVWKASPTETEAERLKHRKWI